MRLLLRTNDAVLLSFVEAVLDGEGIGFLVADRNMSILEGSIGILPRRVLVSDEDHYRARASLLEAGVEANVLVDGRE